jgi:NAD(P)-dependent dehydrogenase (short-subunit alcohol dehydrogenase family)
MDPTLKGKAAVVTGAGLGIGRAIALHMAAEGAQVVVNDLGVSIDGSGADKTPADTVVAEIRDAGGVAVANYDDVSTVMGGENIIRTATDNFGRIDILVNNAGVYRPKLLVEMSEADWDVTMAVHLKGNFCCTKPAATAMIKQRSGRIINMSSGAALGRAGSSNYGAAKAGILGMTWALARELGPHGITVNALFPLAKTRMTQVARSSKKLELPKSLSGSQTPDDVAPLVVYLASDKANNINGSIFSLRHKGTIELHGDPVAVKGIYSETKWTLNDIITAVPALMSGVNIELK